MIRRTRYLDWRPRRRAGWLTLLMMTTISLVMTSVPTFATPALPAPTPLAPAEPTPTETGSCLSPAVEEMMTQLSPIKTPTPLYDAVSECTSSGGTTPAEDPSSEDEDPPSEEEMRKLQEQYGMKGCTEVPGFNDRCPTMVSEPATATPGKRWVAHFKFVPSPDGQFLYGVGWEDLIINHQAVVTAFRVDDGSIAWQNRHLGLPSPSNAAMGVAVSHDGRQLYVTGADTGATSGNAQDGWVAALDTAQGDVLWRQSVISLLGLTGAFTVQGGPAWQVLPSGVVGSADDTRVFVSTGVFHRLDGDLRAWNLSLDAATGSLEWSHLYDGGSSFISWFGMDQLKVSPDGTKLYSQIMLVVSGGFTKGFVTLVLDPATGAVVWERTYRYSDVPGSSRVQNHPAGLMLSSDGSTVYSIGSRWMANNSGRFLVLAYDTTAGSSLWSNDYPVVTDSGCANTMLFYAPQVHGAALSPSGSLLYLVGASMVPSDCVIAGGMHWAAAVLAIDTATGDVEWRAFHDDQSACASDRCSIAVAPGPKGGDAGAQTLIFVDASPPWSRYYYASIVSFDGASGQRLWLARYLDTFNDEASSTDALAGGFASADGTRLYVPISNMSQTRGWTSPDYGVGVTGRVMQVLGYDIRRSLPDVTLESLTVSPAGQGQVLITAVISNIGDAEAPDAVVQFLHDDSVIGNSAPVTVPAGNRATVSYTWNTGELDEAGTVTAVVNPGHTFTESDYDNNQRQQPYP